MHDAVQGGYGTGTLRVNYGSRRTGTARQQNGRSRRRRNRRTRSNKSVSKFLVALYAICAFVTCGLSIFLIAIKWYPFAGFMFACCTTFLLLLGFKSQSCDIKSGHRQSSSRLATISGRVQAGGTQDIRHTTGPIRRSNGTVTPAPPYESIEHMSYKLPTYEEYVASQPPSYETVHAESSHPT